jgi:nucleoside-diphosphate-sugar epimerase
VTRVLVTGAGGFIGRRAVAALVASGHDVHAVGRSAGAEGPGVTWHVADLVAPGEAEGVTAKARAEALLHLAWYAVPGRYWTAPENEAWIGASLRLLRGFAAAGGTRAVLTGTAAEYRWGGELLSETGTPLDPATLYGACKHATHVAARAAAAQLGIGLAWARVFFLYGPEEEPGRLVADVARRLLAGERVATTDGTQVRDFLHVDDVAGALAALLASDVCGAVNVASGRPRSVRDVITAVATAAGGLDRVDFGALPQRPGDPPRIVADVGRLRDEVGFAPAVELEEGVAATVRWWREQ